MMSLVLGLRGQFVKFIGYHEYPALIRKAICSFVISTLYARKKTNSNMPETVYSSWDIFEKINNCCHILLKEFEYIQVQQVLI